jgi:hypothetical protein
MESKRQRPETRDRYQQRERSKFICIKQFASGKIIKIAEAETRQQLIERIKSDSIFHNVDSL